MSNRLVPTSEVADRIKVSVRQVARLVEDGKIVPAERSPGLRGAYLFEPDEVARLEQERAS